MIIRKNKLFYLLRSSTIIEMVILAWNARPLYFLGLIFLQILFGIIPVASAVINKSIFDFLSTSINQSSTDNLFYPMPVLLVGQLGLSLLNQSLGSANNLLSSELIRTLNIKMQLKVFTKINGLTGLATFENPDFYNTIQLGSQGAQIAPSQVLSIVFSFINNFILLINFIGILYFFSPLLLGLVVLAAIPSLTVQLKLGKQRFKLANSLAFLQRKVGYFSFLLSSIQFAKELRTLGVSNYLLGEFEKLTNKVNAAQRKQQFSEARSQIGISTLSTLVSNIVFFVVIWQAVNKSISIGDVTLYLSAVTSIQAAIFGLANNIAQLNENRLFFSKYIDLLHLPQSISITETPREVPPLLTAIELRNVSFRYSDQRPWVLRGVNLRIPSGKSMALVGLNGSGKTTLVKLLTRFYDPTEGQILWNGIDIREFDPVDFRKHISAIFQDFARFDLSANENIGFGDIDNLHDKERIMEAAKSAGIHDILNSLPRGYNSILSRWLNDPGDENEVGFELSGGEWQKIALARLFIRDSDLLLLDEPTSALDVQAESEIYSRFLGLAANRTAIIISHRFSSVKLADNIAVLEYGKITEYGPHIELIRQQGSYEKFFRLQAERYSFSG